MSKTRESYEEHCLYFSTNTLVRQINKMADEAFATTGLAPSYAYLILHLTDEPGLSQNELCDRMQLTPSTMTRFIDKLVLKGLARREQEGRTVYIYPTDKAEETKVSVKNALKILYNRYNEVLGKELADRLTQDIHKANLTLKN
ncbi:MarR family winged helix-turn-helix transcriptional regulator [Sediminitomix flava]|nr:MarR family transcriptional regulator [Sediminitomix flava]